MENRDSAVGMATDCGLDSQGVGVQVMAVAILFAISTSSRPFVGPTRPPIRKVLWALSPVIKRPGR
jgi:hypothetical protein